MNCLAVRLKFGLLLLSIIVGGLFLLGIISYFFLVPLTDLVVYSLFGHDQQETDIIRLAIGFLFTVLPACFLFSVFLNSKAGKRITSAIRCGVLPRP